MLVDRMSYVIFFKGNQVIDKLADLPLDVTYVSKKKRFAIVYADKASEEQIKKALKNIKGFKGFTPSQTFDENLNFNVK